MEKFEALIKKHITFAQDRWLGKKAQMGSPHQKTKVAENPARCTFHQLLVIAEMLERSPYDVMIEYGLGDTGMSDREKQVVEQFLKHWIPKKNKNGQDLPQTLTGV
jgi:hypothetical protein